MKEVKSTRQSTIDAAARGIIIADITAADITAARNDIRTSGNTAAGMLHNALNCLRNDNGRSNRIAVIAARIEAKKY